MSKTIGREVRDKLGGAAGSSQGTIDVASGGVSVSVDAAGCDRYAVGVRGVTVRPAQPVADVGGVAERMAEHVDAFDRLRVVEYDAPERQAILRSSEPERDEGGITYWEATVKPDETSMQRYHKAHHDPDRRLVAEPVTHRDVGRLVDQIVETVNGEQT